MFTADSLRTSAFRLRLQIVLVLILLLRMEILKGLYELIREESLILVKPVFLRAKSRAFNILYFELDHLSRNRGNVDIEIRLHSAHYLVIIIFRWKM